MIIAIDRDLFELVVALLTPPYRTPLLPLWFDRYASLESLLSDLTSHPFSCILLSRTWVRLSGEPMEGAEHSAVSCYGPQLCPPVPQVVLYF